MKRLAWLAPAHLLALAAGAALSICLLPLLNALH